MPGRRVSLDSASDRSIVLAPPHGSRRTEISDTRQPVAVGPGRSVVEALNRYPIQLAKVQRPPLRDDTLARDRLLDWLSVKIHDRVVLLLADAGYGKTTLLADFAQRTRLRTIWYRLDEDDRDWIAFLNYLIAAGREHDPGFAPTTASMLGDMSVGGPTRDAAIDVFLRELPSIAEHGAVLILDDFHLVDESPDVRLIARELVARAPERLTIVFASRRAPTIPLARLRASGEVAELTTDDLRFDVEETRRLFSETYHRPLEPDVLADVAARTEGWAASLQLVQAALRDRSPTEIRRFVRGLSGADQELYDYLAEEVVGDLPEDLQQFLMRTSILQAVSPDLAAVVARIDPGHVGRLTTAAERLTLLTRPSRAARGPHRYHPLVREFLEARLQGTLGEAAVAALHRSVAEAAATSDWRAAAYHYREAGDLDCVATVGASAIPEIMGSGQYAVAVGFIEQIPNSLRSAGLNLVKSRVDMQHGAHETAIALSLAALHEVDPGSRESDHALLNLSTMFMYAGQTEQASQHLDRLRATTANDHLRLIANSMGLMIAAAGSGSLDVLARHLSETAERQRGTHQHYFGVTMLNLAVTATLQDTPSLAAEYARHAIEALQESSSRIELSSAFMAKAMALAMLGLGAESVLEIDSATGLGQVEAELERADIDDSYANPDEAWAILTAVDGRQDLNLNDRLSLALQLSRYLSRRGRHAEAFARLVDVDPSASGVLLGQAAAIRGTMAYAAVAAGSKDAGRKAQEASETAKVQGAEHWRRIAEVLRAACGSADDLATSVRWVGSSSPWNLTFVADVIAARLGDFDEATVQVVAASAQLHPRRWRFVLRQVVATSLTGDAINAARILESVGERSDIKRLRVYARRQRRLPGASSLGRSLARRLADRVFVEDQGRVTVQVGGRQISGSTIRRKVLALLCFLLTKPDLAATRDQVLDALWPDLDPLDAVNSLNQTVYFLRRILEEDYVDDLSPGYLHHDSDLIWFDRDLVTSRSNESRRLIKELPLLPTPDQVFKLSEQYAGRFALDFEYEEWATPYRDWLHASFLEIVERAVTDDIATGHFERGIRLARRVLDVDPLAEQVEVSLLRLYRASGAHAAAAEQYGHYAAVMRNQLGVDPPPLDVL